MQVLDKPLTNAEQTLALRRDAALRRSAPDLEPATIASWNDHPVLFRDRTQPWILLPIELDPLTTKGGGYPFPRDVATELARVAKSGATFDRICVAHELGATSGADQLLATSTSGQMVLTPKDARHLIGTTVPATPALAEKGKGLDRRLSGLVAGSISAAASAAEAIGSMVPLDPIVFGVVGVEDPPREGLPALYYPLAAWTW